jgi:hypothetical protein
MYKIIWKDETDVSFEEQYETLDLAMAKAKELGVFVTIVGSGFEVVGLFGVDTIADGKCPDGVDYDWNKTSRIGAAKRVRV